MGIGSCRRLISGSLMAARDARIRFLTVNQPFLCLSLSRDSEGGVAENALEDPGIK